MIQVIKESLMQIASGTQAKGDFWRLLPTYLMLRGYLVYWINTSISLKSNPLKKIQFQDYCIDTPH